MRDNKRYKDFDIGEYTYGQPDVIKAKQYGTLKIGRFCSIAGGVVFHLFGNHRVDWATTFPFTKLFTEASGIQGYPQIKGDIVVGNDVWIGTNACVLAGVTIGNGAVVGAGSMVTRNVPPYAIVAGNPAKLIRYRFSPGQIAKLEEIAWWDWPIEKIIASLPLMLNEHIDTFIEACMSGNAGE